MDCAQFDEVLHDLDRPGTKGAALRDAALAHAESCNRCAELLSQAEWLDFSLLRLKVESPLTIAPARLESALLQKFKRTMQKSARRRVLRRAALMGAAAALLLALGLSLRRHGTARPTASAPGSNVSVVPSAQIPAAPAPAQGASLDPGVSPVAAGGGRPDQSIASQEDEPALETASFVKLPYADDSLADEGGAIVRVQISRSALASLGLPVWEGEGAGRVQADLVLSADGTPQAIRLVSQVEPAEEF
jgi:hypothetical protein